jgi:phospholipase/carboxylesterase
MSLSFSHRYQPGTHSIGLTLILLHGTGGDENDLIPVGTHLMPGAGLLSPRGKVSEQGANRFFRRLAEGVLDIDDWRFRSNELADFILAASKQYNFDLARAFAVGFSNGANIATGLLLLRPEVLAGAILFRPMFVSEVKPPSNLKGKEVLIHSGTHDPLLRQGDTELLEGQFTSAGAEVLVHLAEAGHSLTSEDIVQAREWLESRIPS